jgi:heterodisulfide reductase subunit A-like polyferredoxin/coenzyme F420-reducing hydrogenase delta subunit
MSKTNVRIGIYLCDCDGKLSEKVDVNRVKAVIQSEADFEYIRLTDILCGKMEKERLAEECRKYSLNRLLIAACDDPFITKQFYDVAVANGIKRYEVDFVDLSSVSEGTGDGTDEAIARINTALVKMQLRAEIGIEEVAVTPDVLVIGCGSDGAAAALKIAKSQPVTIVGGEAGAPEGISLVSGNSSVSVKAGAKIVGLEGFAGNFTVELTDGSQVSKQKFGAIVLATGTQPVYDKNKYGGIEPGEQVFKLSQFIREKQDFSGRKITFVLGQADTDSMISSALALEQAIALKEKGAATVNILYDDMKISADLLEQDYETARDRGVNFLKYAGELQFSSTIVAATVQYKEPFLPDVDQIALTSDYLVLAEDYAPAASTQELAETLWINIGPEGFFQDDNVHFLPIKSNREGIYFVGSCHGSIYAVELNREVEDVVAEVAKLASGKVSVPSLQPLVEAEKCVVCLTCYRTCPHHAIEIVHDESLNNMYHSAARMDPLACRHCGTCAGECPGKAIQLPLYSDAEILYSLSKPPSIVAYACENSGALAAQFAKKMAPELQANLQIVRVPCSGKIDALYLLKALERGADGVLLLVCHQANCKYVWGNERAEKRKEQVRKLLSQAGLEEERVDLVHVAANQGNQFNAAVRDMAERVHQLGTIPGKVIK